MTKKIGFIGCGNMAQAIMAGIIASKLISAENVMASNRSKKKLDVFAEKFNIKKGENNTDVAKFGDIVFLAVKPDKFNDIIDEIKESINEEKIIVSIAGGITIDYLQKKLGKNKKIVRVMPNTPAVVMEAMTAVSFNSNLGDEEKKEITEIFQSFGKAEVIEEKLMDAIPGISGSSPAYVYMFIEALADGGVLTGIPRDKAYKFAAQAVLGAAKMVLETGEHPGKLKDNVCSPSGTTIESVYSLEKNNFRGAVIEAVQKCYEKTTAMSEANK
ncbi:MAG: pyrroline-5-carboxylate reductase [Clostridiaceae bacterium]|jgi:pyrroline-5-carboxylate reductase|nr:pyrroline-5-carboxylate reductase [Clostridiaceae bacterium]